MSDEATADAIVVGGGPAGLAAAITMARKGLDVILVERGEYAGAKNVGGLFYGTVLNQIIPEAWKQAPIERTVARRGITYLGDGQHIGLTFGADAWSEPPYNHTYVVHRAQFDRWLAKQAEDAGVSILEGMLVEEVRVEGDGAQARATGVRLQGDETLGAGIVILADGANCLVSDQARQRLGLQAGERPQEYAVGAKEIIALPREKIDDRFNLRDREGGAYDFLGEPFDGIIGGGFLYTAGESVHLGVVARIDSLVESKLAIHDLSHRFKTHPVIRRYLEGGELLEYSGHMLPEGGSRAMGELTGNGLMITGDAAGLLNMSLYKEGTNHAMESGVFAGEAAAEAKARGDVSKAGLAGYERRLRAGVGWQDVENYRDLPDTLAACPELLSAYPRQVTRMLVDYFTVTGEPKAVLQKRARQTFWRDTPRVRLARNLWKARKLM